MPFTYSKSVGAEFPSEVGPTSNKVGFEFKLHFRALRRLARHAPGNDAHPDEARAEQSRFPK